MYSTIRYKIHIKNTNELFKTIISYKLVSFNSDNVFIKDEKTIKSNFYFLYDVFKYKDAETKSNGIFIYLTSDFKFDGWDLGNCNKSWCVNSIELPRHKKIKLWKLKIK